MHILIFDGCGKLIFLFRLLFIVALPARPGHGAQMAYEMFPPRRRSCFNKNINKVNTPAPRLQPTDDGQLAGSAEEDGLLTPVSGKQAASSRHMGINMARIRPATGTD